MMILNSEKDLYIEEFQIIKQEYDMDLFLWGEDLLDKRLVIYNGEIWKQPDYSSLEDGLVDSALIIVNPDKGKPLKCIESITHLDAKLVFLREDQFNLHWKFLKKSIVYGSDREMGGEQESKISDTIADILDMSRLIRNNSIPYVEKNKIVYKTKSLSADEIRQNGLKQRILDNQNNLYFYEKDGGVVHDKGCGLIKRIDGDSLIGSGEFPAGYEFCRKCMRHLLVRIGCAPHTKNISISNRFLNDNGVKTAVLRKMVIDNKLQFFCTNLREMEVKGAEDSWKIIVSQSGESELWHNNYVKINERERYITEGFHNQNLGNTSMWFILNYIASYTWEKHLEGEKREIIEEPKAVTEVAPEVIMDTKVVMDTKVESKEEELQKSKFFYKIVNWFRNVIQKRK